MKQLAALALISFALAVFPACSDDDTGDRESFLEACNAHCEHVGAATGCAESVATDDVAECKDGCPMVERLYGAECFGVLEDFYLCSMSNYTFQCDEGGDDPYVEIGEVDPCQEETDAMFECIFAAWGEDEWTE